MEWCHASNFSHEQKHGMEQSWRWKHHVFFYIYRCVHGKLCMRAIDWYEMASLCSCQNGWISNIGAKHANPIDANCLSTLKIERKTATKHWSDFFKIILVGTFWPSLHFVRTQIRFAEKFWTKKKHWRSKKKNSEKKLEMQNVNRETIRFLWSILTIIMIFFLQIFWPESCFSSNFNHTSVSGKFWFGDQQRQHQIEWESHFCMQ